MTVKEFNEAIRADNKAYRDLFGYIPCIVDYSCTREEYMIALKETVLRKKEIKNLLPEYLKETSYSSGSEV